MPKAHVIDKSSWLDRICLGLADKGWCGGDPTRVAEMPIDWAIKSLHYINSKSELMQETKQLMNIEQAQRK